MPQGLAPVTAGFTQRRWPRLRPFVKPLLGAFLALTGVLAPIESPDLPAPLDDLGEQPAWARAQTSAVVAGVNTEGCPADATDLRPWIEDPIDNSLCVLLTPPCLATPWDSGQYLQRSIQFPEFCEISVSSSDPNYAACIVTTGVVVINNGLTCRIIQNAICPSGVRIGPFSCRVVERRTWTCPAGSVPRNEFDTCYRLPAPRSGTHPACGPGAPTLLILSCDEYVGYDVVQNPSTVTCGSYDPTATPPRIIATTPPGYWCTYESRLLDLDCYASSASCATTTALCLKRASGTGGCSVVAKTIRCRSLQASYAAGSNTLEDVRAAFCEPCVILPFQSIPASCPDDLTDQPTPSSRHHSNLFAFEAVLSAEQDIFMHRSECFRVTGGWVWPTGPVGGEPLADHPACAAYDSPCPDPYPGRLTWRSSHFSQLAVINSPVTVQVVDIPAAYRTQKRGFLFGNVVRTATDTLIEYPEPDPAEPDNLVRLWTNPDDTTAYGDVPAMATSGAVHECILRHIPLYKLVVRELWPDNPSDRLDIDNLFGTDALQWWDAMTSDEQRRHTGARGLGWWPDLSNDERNARITRMTQDVSCDSEVDAQIWCRWRALKSGYFELRGAGAWLLLDSGNREWINPGSVARINSYLGGLSTAGRSQLLSDLGASTPAEAGLNPTMDTLLPIGSPESLYTVLYEYARCPATDLRIICTNSQGTANYVETEPIGLMVHEMRTSTVIPSN